MWDYKEFKDFLKYNDQEIKRLTYTNYIEIYGDNPTIESESFYIEYLSKFKPVEYCIDESLANEFNFELLLRLTAGSFSSVYELQLPKNETIPELMITVGSCGQKVTRTITSLMPTQLKRMFDIYVEENMNLSILLNEDEGERVAIEGERLMRINQYQDRINEIKAFTGFRKAEQKISNRVNELLKKL